MKKIHIWLVLEFMLVGLPQLTKAQSTWTFRVLVAVEPQTATYYPADVQTNPRNTILLNIKPIKSL